MAGRELSATVNDAFHKLYDTSLLQKGRVKFRKL